jgi:hypothetical protein
MSTEVAELSDAEKAEAYDKLLAEQEETRKAKQGPPRYKVIVSDPTANDRTLFSSVSQNRARTWVEQHVPRGQHVFVLNPDGSMDGYEFERISGGPQGEDVEMWQPFDRDEYSSPELTPVNVHDPWADAWEGAQ